MNLTGPGLTADDYHAALYGERSEPVAPFCPGPGHLLDTDEEGFTVRLEDCPSCATGPVRNHTTFRSPA